MSKSSSQQRADFLGMSYGAAAHRLRKQILFRYVQRSGDDICYRCNEKIETVESLSIEHKQPWESRDVALFWDLNNIAFSHLSCNSKASSSPHKIIATEGQSWCSGCQAFHDVSAFRPQLEGKQSRNGLRRECRSHEAATKAAWRLRNRRH